MSRLFKASECLSLNKLKKQDYFIKVSTLLCQVDGGFYFSENDTFHFPLLAYRTREIPPRAVTAGNANMPAESEVRNNPL